VARRPEDIIVTNHSSNTFTKGALNNKLPNYGLLFGSIL